MEPPQPTFSFLTLIHHLVKQSHDELKRCVVEIKKGMEANDQSTRESSDREALMKKQILYQYFQETRERFIRLLVLLRWSKKSKKTLDKLNQVASSMEMKANAFDLAAFTLFFTSKKVASLIEPVFDLPTAIDVLTTGTYPRLPNIMQQFRGNLQNIHEDFTVKDKEKAVSKLTDLIRMKLLQCTIPPNMFVNKLENGQVNLIAENEFSIIMTLNHKQDLSGGSDDVKYFWQIIYLDLLVNEVGVTVSPLYDELVHGKLVPVLQKRLYFLDESDTGVSCMVDLYNTIHAVVVRIAMDILTKQAKQLRWGNDVISCDTFNDNIDEDLSLSIKYWIKAPPMITFMEKYTSTEPGVADEKSTLLKEKSARNEIRIFVDRSKQIIFDYQPKLKLNFSPQINMSKINLSQTITECIYAHTVERLCCIRTHLLIERIFENVVLITDPSTNQAELGINVFEDYMLRLSIDWKTGYFLLSLSCDDQMVNVDFSDILFRLNNIDIRKVKFSQVITDVLETARKRTIIYAYKSAAQLLELDVFPTLFEGGSGTLDQTVYFAFPNISTAFIQIKAVEFAYMRSKPLVSCRIIIERHPKLIDISVPSSLFLDVSLNSDEEENENIGEPNSKRVKRMKSASFQNTLVAFRHIKQVINSTKHKVSFSTMLRQVQASSKFSFELTDQEYEMIILPNESCGLSYFDIDYISLSVDVDNAQWVATCYERKPLPVIIPSDVASSNYVNGRLTFKYSTIRNSKNVFDDLYQDLLSVDKMYPLVLQLIDPNPQFAVLLNQTCNIEWASHTKIRLDYGKSGYKAMIKWSEKKFRLVLHPTNRFEYELDDYLNKSVRNDPYGESMFKLTQLLLKFVLPLNKLKQLLSDRNPTAWYIIPRSVAEFKVIYQQTISDKAYNREFMVTCNPTSIIEIKEIQVHDTTRELFQLTTQSYGDDLDQAIFKLKRYVVLPKVLENMKATIEFQHHQAPHYNYTLDCKDYELKISKITSKSGSVLNEAEEEFLKDAFSKCYLNAAIYSGVHLLGSFYSNSFIQILFSPPALLKDFVQTWQALKDRIDFVFFVPYPFHAFSTSHLHDDSKSYGELRVPKVFANAVASSDRLVEKESGTIRFFVRVYIQDDYIDLPILLSQTSEPVKFLFGSPAAVHISAGSSIIEQSKHFVSPGSSIDNPLFRLLTYVLDNCTIQQLMDMQP
ncbi:hypothetical protein C9374_000491 [Naegleria lovaniensis]|uniref:Mediator of RNA polymerase II transcription subunit 14 n=1 Tax=Naegleria lovaniensis TaxID=51637 RepID=A0AA88GT01_NAELO|nr:uncharacterized protein C9374_000491 [Naegleria lovaniensis]KAG2388327.1 hypothetical protein C9374_000491 [Naegleria lovaniensis]